MEGDDRFPLPDPASGSPAASRRRGGPDVYDLPEQENENPLLAYGRILRKRRWTVISVLIVILTVVLIATSREKPVYRATAMIEIQREDPSIVTVRKLFQLPNVSDEYLATQYRLLRSRSLARTVIAKLHLDQTEEFNPPSRSWPFTGTVDAGAANHPLFSTDPAHEQAVLTRFENRLVVHPIRGSRLVELSFDSHNPRRAAQVLNAMTAAYIQGNLRNHWMATQEASQWLSGQLDQLRLRLEKS